MPTLKIRDEVIKLRQNKTLAAYSGPVVYLVDTSDSDVVVTLPPWSGSDMVTIINNGDNSVVPLANADGALVCGLSTLPTLRQRGSRLRLVPNATLGWTALNPIMSVE